MIAFTGHRPRRRRRRSPSTPTRSSSASSSAPRLEGRADDTEDVIRRRQELYADQTAPLIGVYRDRGLLIEVDGMGEVDDVTGAHPRRRSSPSPRAELLREGVGSWVFATAGSSIKSSRTQIDVPCGEPAWWSGAPWRSCVPPYAPASRPSELDADRRGPASGPAGATPSFLGYHGFPASICASVNDEVVHGIPGPTGARRGRRGLPRLRGHRRRLARRRGHHRRRR